MCVCVCVCVCVSVCVSVCVCVCVWLCMHDEALKRLHSLYQRQKTTYVHEACQSILWLYHIDVHTCIIISLLITPENLY